MKAKFRQLFIALSSLALSTLNSQLSTALAQGSLTPPGAPAPTMKTLDQVEARTPISSLPYTISSPGSYYVTSNLTGVSGSDGITIVFLPLVENVTVDLNGFTLTGVAGSHNGIHAAGLSAGRNYVFRNGTLRNWGMDGVNASGAINSRFEKLQLYANTNMGLEAGTNCIVSDCAAYSNAVAGISVLTGGNLSHCVAANNGIGLQTLDGCVVADCTASGNSGDGISVGAGVVVRSCAVNQNSSTGVNTGDNCTVKDCSISSNFSGISGADNCTVENCTANANHNSGISGGNNCTVKDCTSSANGQDGVVEGDNCTVENCTASANRDSGITAINNCSVKDCTSSANMINGILVGGNNCQIVGNTCVGGYYGIAILGGQNRIDNNSVGNSIVFGINPGQMNVTNSITRNSSPGPGYGNTSGNNDYAPIGTPNTATSPWANFH
jgi:hypothetical protein